MKSLLLWMAFLILGSAYANTSIFDQVKKLTVEEKYQEAFDLLSKAPDSKFKKEDLPLKYFALGLIGNDIGKRPEAKGYFQHSLDISKDFEPYIHYILGHIAKEDGDPKKAKVLFNDALKTKPPRNINYSTRNELAEIHMQEKQWITAYKHLKHLERQWRNTDKHPGILWSLIKAEKQRKRQWRACRWARTVYSYYPVNPLVHDWGVDLENNLFEGKQLGCQASFKDQQRRFNRLQWSGESQRALKEINELVKRAKGTSEEYKIATLLAEYNMREGYHKEALDLLLKYYNKKQKDFSYLRLLARSAAKAGEFPAAVGSYYKVHELRPRSGIGRRSLFSAAFLSYQFQDYDGASRKFREFTKKYKRSGLSRDAEWHLAWIHYLKGQYKESVNDFKNILAQRKKHRRRWSSYSVERINYWLAMSYFKMKNFEKARPIFEELTKNKLISYYSVAADSRLNLIPQVGISRKIAQDIMDSTKEEEKEMLKKELAMPGTILPEADKLVTSEEEESEETLEKDDTVATVENNEVEVEAFKISFFKDEKLRHRFYRATSLIRIGRFDWAKWELYEIERRTRNKSYLRELMKAYEQIDSFNRSTYLGYTYFLTERERFGTNGAKDLWQHAYPQAFKEHVIKYSGEHNVSPWFAWGIMRAESHFKHDVVSPVGAKGLMQIMPHTGRKISQLMGNNDFHPNELVKPEVNVKLGTRYLSRLLRKFKGYAPLAAAGYNAGPHRVESWLNKFGHLEMDEFIEHIPFVETRNYVKKVVRNYAIYNEIYGKEKQPFQILAQNIPVYFENPQARETWEKLQ